MGPEHALTPAIIFLLAGVVSAFASRAVRLSPVIGYLFAGVIIGPSALDLVEDNSTTHFLAELGVVFLLFDIGLHFSLDEVRSRRDDILRFAPMQVAMCGFVFAGLGILFGFDIPVALIVGASLGLSSTAVVARILADRRKPGCPIGRSATAVLVAQDIVAIFIIVFAAVINEAPEAMGIAIVMSLGKAVIALAIALVAGRFVVKPAFRALAATNNQEAFTVVALLIVLTAAAATAGVGLSLTAGAFLAGMALSETQYRHVIQAEIKPFQSLLLGLFFMSVGMGVDLGGVLARWPAVLLVAAGILLIKSGLIFVSARLSKRNEPVSAQLGFLLSQGSEFTLVVVALPAVASSMPGTWSSLLVSAVAVTMVAAPVWTNLGVRLAHWIAARSKADLPAAPEHDLGPPVLILGMSEETRLAADALRDHDIHYVALEADPEQFVSAASDGYDVVYGDPRDGRLLQMTNASSPRAIVHALARQPMPPGLLQPAAPGDDPPPRFISVPDQSARIRNASLGLRAHVSAAKPAGVEMTTDLLTWLGVEQAEITEWLEDQLRRRGLLRDPEEEEDEAEVESA